MKTSIRWGGADCVAGTWFWGGRPDWSLPPGDPRRSKYLYERRFFWQAWTPFHPFAPRVHTIGIGPVVITRRLGYYGSRRKGGQS